VESCHSLLNTFIIIPPSELRHYPTVTFVRAVHGIKALMLTKASLRKSEAVRNVIGDTELQYQSYLGALQNQLLLTSGESKCRVPSMVGELVKFLAGDRKPRAFFAGNTKRAEETVEESDIPTPPIPCVKGTSSMAFQPFETGSSDNLTPEVLESAFQEEAATAMYHDGFQEQGNSSSADHYGSDLDMLQMPEFGDLSFLASHGFGFEPSSRDAEDLDYWGLPISETVSMQVPEWPT
jgi:hypothetical protein